MRKNGRKKAANFNEWILSAESKEFIRTLLALDMNVIVTARQKVQYADGAFMRAIGETFDGEKSLPYLFDTIVRLYRDDKGRFLGECLKDRSNKLPLGEFECSYAQFEELFGKKSLARKARPTPPIPDEQNRQILRDSFHILTTFPWFEAFNCPHCSACSFLRVYAKSATCTQVPDVSTAHFGAERPRRIPHRSVVQRDVGIAGNRK